MKKIVIITGLTCTGKSNLAVEIAKSFNGEIISADSVQVYRGLNIGSAKISLAEQQGIKHHLIDIKNFNETYNVGEFVADAKTAIDEILNKGKLPIIVGGTGLYIKALLEGYSFGNAFAHEDFRQKLNNLAQEKGNLYVWSLLNSKNPNKAKTVHFNNIKRVIRYLEIEEFGKEQPQQSILKDFKICAVAVIDEREKIYEKINARVDKMVELGLENEVRTLIENGATQDMQSIQAIGYKEWFDYFAEKENRLTTIELIKQHSRNYCKRQLTFLKTIKNLKFCNISTAQKIIKEFL